MSLPNIPNITPKIDLSLEDSIKVILNSLALNDIGLSNIVNTEGEKLQYIIGVLNSENNRDCYSDEFKCTNNQQQLLEINRSIKSTLRDVLRNQIIMQMKMEDTLELYNRLIRPDVVGKNVSISVSQCSDEDDVDGINCNPIYF